ncbi:hypothetical protein LPJ68_002924 [Coemansia sp. RSA 1086]|nr:hypothetical protein LPJ68_002924 [Coemansia sp. RSA 1086]
MHQASSVSSRLRDRRAQLQQRRAMSRHAHTEQQSFVTGQPQFNFSISPFPLEPNTIPEPRQPRQRRDSHGLSPPSPARHAQNIDTTFPEQLYSTRQRSVTAEPESNLVTSPEGERAWLLPQEECGDRIERLLQRVHRAQQTRREGQMRMEMASPRAHTRFDSPQRQPAACHGPREQAVVSVSNTVSTASLRSDATDMGSRSMLPATEPFSPRRRAATMDPAIEKTPGNKGDRAQFDFDETPVASEPVQSPIEAIKTKIARVRARREARLKQEGELDMPLSSPASHSTVSGGRPVANRMHSEISGTTYYTSDDDSDDDFFESWDNQMLFREMELPLKDLEWDKRVYYHHVARTNDKVRRALEDVEIADCRESCLGELLGKREAARVLQESAGEAPMAGQFAQPNQAEAQAVAEWMDADDDSDVSSDCQSFDWTQNGFGYMEFRRRSRSSLASSSIAMSPTGERTPRHGLAALLANEQPRPISALIESPFASPSAMSRPQSTSLADRSSIHGSVSSSTARAATADFSEALGAAAAVPLAAAAAAAAAGPGRRCAGAPADLEAVEEVDEGGIEDEWMAMGSSGEFGAARALSEAEEDALAREQLSFLQCENHEMRQRIQQMRRVMASLTQLAVAAS